RRPLAADAAEKAQRREVALGARLRGAHLELLLGRVEQRVMATGRLVAADREHVGFLVERRAQPLAPDALAARFDGLDRRRDVARRALGRRRWIEAIDVLRVVND